MHKSNYLRINIGILFNETPEDQGVKQVRQQPRFSPVENQIEIKSGQQNPQKSPKITLSNKIGIFKLL